jgi:hypothetical protein
MAGTPLKRKSGSGGSAYPRLTVQLQARELARRELDIDLLVLRAEDVDLRHVVNLQQPGASALDVVAQLTRREAVGGEGVEDAVRVAEVVVEAWSDDTGRESPANVGDLLAHLVPFVRHILAARRAEQVDEHRRDPGRRVALDVVELRRLL